MPLSYQRFMNDFMYLQKTPRVSHKSRDASNRSRRSFLQSRAHILRKAFFTNKNLTKAKNIKLRTASKGFRLTIIYAIIIQNNNPFGKENRGKSVKKQFFRLFCWKMIQKFKIIFLILRPVRENKFY